jgi:hypothetical protein
MGCTFDIKLTLLSLNNCKIGYGNWSIKKICKSKKHDPHPPRENLFLPPLTIWNYLYPRSHFALYFCPLGYFTILIPCPLLFYFFCFSPFSYFLLLSPKNLICRSRPIWYGSRSCFSLWYGSGFSIWNGSGSGSLPFQRGNVPKTVLYFNTSLLDFPSQ